MTPTDIDECELELDSCSQDAACINTPASFECKCLPGFFGDGATCEGALYMLSRTGCLHSITVGYNTGSLVHRLSLCACE